MLGEREAERTENSKTYMLDDYSTIVFVTEFSIHKKDNNGNWIELYNDYTYPKSISQVYDLFDYFDKEHCNNSNAVSNSNTLMKIPEANKDIQCEVLSANLYVPEPMILIL